MEPVATTFFFYLLSGLAVLGGVLVITRKNPVHSALALILTLLALAGLYLMLYAPFVAGVQIILYAGGIMVLFLFVIMLVSIEKVQREDMYNKQWIAGLLSAVALGGLDRGRVREGAEAPLPDGTCRYRKRPTRRRLRSCCTAIMCSPSRSPHCCCWWRSSERW